MAKKFFTKALSVGLSLTLCASLVAPSFAAVALDKDAHIGADGYLLSHEETNEAGDTVQSYDYYLDQDIELDQTLKIKAGTEASLNLNHHELALNKGMTIEVDEDNNAHILVDGEEKVVHDADRNVIEGSPDDLKQGSVIDNRGKLTITDEDVEDVERGSLERGTITGGYNPNGAGGGIYYGPNTTLTGIQISDNYASSGGAVYGNSSPVNLTDVKISDNVAIWGAAFSGNTFQMTLNGVEISDNISTNGAICDGGAGSSVTANDCIFAGNQGKYFIYNSSHGYINSSKFCGNSFSEGLEERGPDMTMDESTQENMSETPEEFEWIETPAQIGVEGKRELTCKNCGRVIKTEAIPALQPERTPTPVTRIGDQAIPLADGPVTRAQFIDYLWRHEGEPASNGACTFTDVAEDHEYFDALCWAEESGIAVAGEDGAFQPDELVTVGAVREFLGSFETVFGAQAVAAADLATLTGADDEAVLNCGEVLAEFFGEEYAPAEAEDELAA